MYNNMALLCSLATIVRFSIRTTIDEYLLFSNKQHSRYKQYLYVSVDYPFGIAQYILNSKYS